VCPRPHPFPMRGSRVAGKRLRRGQGPAGRRAARPGACGDRDDIRPELTLARSPDQQASRGYGYCLGGAPTRLQVTW
jgi:hypothetical protein